MILLYLCFIVLIFFARATLQKVEEKGGMLGGAFCELFCQLQCCCCGGDKSETSVFLKDNKLTTNCPSESRSPVLFKITTTSQTRFACDGDENEECNSTEANGEI